MSFELISALQHYAPPQVRTNDGTTALHLAAWQGHLGVVQTLAEAGRGRHREGAGFEFKRIRTDNRGGGACTFAITHALKLTMSPETHVGTPLTLPQRDANNTELALFGSAIVQINPNITQNILNTDTVALQHSSLFSID